MHSKLLTPTPAAPRPPPPSEQYKYRQSCLVPGSTHLSPAANQRQDSHRHRERRQTATCLSTKGTVLERHQKQRPPAGWLREMSQTRLPQPEPPGHSRRFVPSTVKQPSWPWCISPLQLELCVPHPTRPFQQKGGCLAHWQLQCYGTRRNPECPPLRPSLQKVGCLLAQLQSFRRRNPEWVYFSPKCGSCQLYTIDHDQPLVTNIEQLS